MSKIYSGYVEQPSVNSDLAMRDHRAQGHQQERTDVFVSREHWQEFVDMRGGVAGLSMRLQGELADAMGSVQDRRVALVVAAARFASLAGDAVRFKNGALNGKKVAALVGVKAGDTLRVVSDGVKALEAAGLDVWTTDPSDEFRTVALAGAVNAAQAKKGKGKGKPKEEPVADGAEGEAEGKAVPVAENESAREKAIRLAEELYNHLKANVGDLDDDTLALVGMYVDGTSDILNP